MSVSLGVLRAGVQAHGFATDTAAQQTFFLNSIQRSVCADTRWPFLEAQQTAALAGGANTISVATPVMQWGAVRFIDSRGFGYNTSNLEPQAMRDIQITADPTFVGPPQYWSLRGNTLLIWPTADMSYTAQIDYTARPVDMVADTDNMSLPDEFQDVLIYGACMKMSERERDIYSVESFSADYQRAVQSMQDAYLLRQVQTSSRVKKSGAWNGYSDTLTSGYPFSVW